jgi:transglutaminase-like putative cysteine protease
VLRAHAIPARALTGRWALSAERGPGKEAYDQQHVKAEFFAKGVGWVPVDPALAVVYDKTPDGLRYFGNDEGDFVTMHLDNAMVLDTVYFGRKTVDWLQAPAYWVSGEGSFDGLVTKEKWQVRAEPLDLREAVFRKPNGRGETTGTKKAQEGTRGRPMP